MINLNDLQPYASVRGIIPDALVTVVSVQWFGSEALELTYKTPAGKVANELLYRHDEPRLEIVEVGRPWSFDGDGSRFRVLLSAIRDGVSLNTKRTHSHLPIVSTKPPDDTGGFEPPKALLCRMLMLQD